MFRVAVASVLGDPDPTSSSASFRCSSEKKFVLIWSSAVRRALTLSQLYISEVVIGTAFGVIMGPYCAGIFDPRSWASDTRMITLEVMRVVLAIGLFAIGVELPASYMGRHVRGLVILVVPTMAIGWLVVAGSCFPPSL